MGNPNKECETTFGGSATIVAETLTHSEFMPYSSRLQQMVYKNVLYEQVGYIVAWIKSYFYEIAPP